MSDWQRVQTLFLATVDMSPAERTAYLRTACQDDAALLAEVESLIATDSDDATPIEMAIQREAASLFDNEVRDGSRVGQYRIVREIGRGGMGSVNLAVRDDDVYRKEVALKIVKRGMDTADVLERFRYERQILANLDHPYIARLLDGGATRDGVPYFVMEYIEGRPLDVYCREHALSREARLDLFLKVLEAVAYAHRNLVVHRDLKPANILITADGTPKLLDFGVAKLLGGDPDLYQTRTTSIRPYTPWYASPEQVKGLPITTSSDIYSLGAILYELLTGERAQNIGQQTPVEIERVVCDTSVTRPSLRVPGLSHDLDNIVLMAVRKEPERRYASAVQFADDVRRHREARPILATPNSVRYQVGRFVKRNRLPVAMSAMLALALVAGLIVSLVQWRRARTAEHLAEAQRVRAEEQRVIAQQQTAIALSATREADQQRTLADQQRDAAQQQKQLADDRVKDMRDLAGHTLFDVNDALSKLPGATAARQAVVQTTLAYLESLEREHGLDDNMRESLAGGYYKVAMVQGDVLNPSLGDMGAAEKSLLKAQAILMPAYNAHPENHDLQMRLIEVKSSLADFLHREGKQRESIKMYEDLIPVAHKVSSKHCEDLDCDTQEAVLENEITNELYAIDPKAALEHANRGIALERALLAKYPDSPRLQQGLGVLLATTASLYRSIGELENSAKNYQQSIEIREALHRQDPNDVNIMRSLVILYGNYSALLGTPWMPNLNEPDDARIYAAKGVAYARQLVAADAQNATARRDLGMMLSRAGMIDPAPSAEGIQASLDELNESLSYLMAYAQANPKSSEAATQVGMVLEYQAHRLTELGKPDEAHAVLERSIAYCRPFATSTSSGPMAQIIVDEEQLAMLDAKAGNRDVALAMGQKMLHEAEAYYGTPHTDTARNGLATAWATLALVETTLNDRPQAEEAAQKADALWQSVQQRGVLSQHRQLIADIKPLLPAH